MKKIIPILCLLIPLSGVTQSSLEYKLSNGYTLLDTTSTNSDSLNKMPELILLLNPNGDSCATVSQFKNTTSLSVKYNTVKEIGKHAVLKQFRLIIVRNGKEIFNKDCLVSPEQFTKNEYDGVTESYLLSKKVLKIFSTLQVGDKVKFASPSITLDDGSNWTFEKRKSYTVIPDDAVINSGRKK